ncbi:MAG: efflux RND transporter permease subunit [Chloroflexota bacterium]|nr:MAG: efflux RND transporter permease subunit [Chloroflexota bacterium]
MMRWIVSTSLKYRFLVVAAAAALMLYGITQIGNMPVDVFPEFALPKVEIQTPSLGLSAVEVEELVTVQLEQALNGVPGLQLMRSRSVPDLSDIVLLFNPGTDLLHARQLVQERVSTVVLPTWAAPPVILQPLSSTSRVMKIGISSKEHDLMDLSMITYWKIRARLLRVPGVANVPIWGERIKMPQVQVDPERMRAHNVSLDEVMDVTASALNVGILQFSDGSVIGTGGFFDTPNQRINIQHKLPILTPETLAQVPINDRKKSDGTPLLLSDVAEIKWDTWPLIGDAVINQGEGLMLIVEKLPWGNTLEVTRGVEEAIDEMRPGLPGVDIDTTIFRPATFIEVAINNLTESLLFGSILVVVVLFLFLWDWRIAMISLVIIPLSLMTSLLVLNAQGTTINVMVLAGLVIAIGAVVDDAIVDVENIVRRLRQLRKEGSDKPLANIVLDASLEVRGAIVYASLIEISALLPVFFLEGLSGSFFKPLASAYVVAGLVSPLIALTVTPALVLILLSRASVEHRESPIVRWLHPLYDKSLGWVVARPRVAFGSLAVIVLLGIAVIPFLGQELLPSFKERDFLMHWLTKPGTSHPEMYRITVQACRELLTIPGVRNCGSHIGQALLADEPYGVNFTENWISVDPAVDYDKTLGKIQELVDGYPGVLRDVQTYLKERIREVLTGSSDAVVIRLYGQDLHVLHDKGAEVQAALKGIPGIADLKMEQHADIPHVEVEVKLDQAKRYGVKPGDVRRASAVMISGEEVGDIFIDGKTYDVNVWSTAESRDSLTDLQELLIDTPNGRHVRLAEVADVRLVATPNVVERVGQSRKFDVSANVKGRDLGSVAQDVEAALKQVEFPLGYHAEVLGEYKERQTAQRNLFTAGIVAVIAIFFLLRTSLGNWRLATITFFTLPWALVGGLLAAFLAGGGVLSLGSLVGFLTILGIATRNGIMMISHFQHLEAEEGEPFGPGLVLRGARERIAPILMTALTTGLALVPLVVSGNIAGHEIEHPMAIVILGGLVTSTLLNLFIVPSIYLRFGKSKGSPSNASAVVAPQAGAAGA